MKQNHKTEAANVEIFGIPARIVQIVSKPGPKGATVTLDAIRGKHDTSIVIKAMNEARKRAGAVNVVWSDPPPDRSELARDYREGELTTRNLRFKWAADWSEGVRVIVFLPIGSGRDQRIEAAAGVRVFFRDRLRTEVDQVSIERA